MGDSADSSLRAYLARSRAALPLIPVAVLAIFLPALVVPYAFTDDYPVLSIGDGLGGSPAFGTNILDTVAASGRPLAGLLDDAVFSATGSVENLRFVRLVSVIGILVLAVLLHRALTRSRFGSMAAALIVVLVCSLPPFQEYGAWAVLFNVPYGAILAAGASMLVVSALEGSRRLMLDRLVGAVVFMLGALLIYQPAAMFFWVFLAVALLGAIDSSRTFWRLAVAHVGIAGIALAVAYVTFKTRYFDSVSPNARASLTIDVGGKIRWFFRDALFQALNLGDLTPGRAVASVVAVVALVGVPLFLHKRGATNPFAFVVVAALLVPATYIPNLLVRENLAYYRTQLALSSLLAIYACVGAIGIWLAVRDWLRTRVAAGTVHWAGVAAATAGVAVVVASVVAAARNTTTLFVIPQNAEWRLISNQVAALPTGARRVAFAPTAYNRGMAPLVRYDEFGLPSTAHVFVYEPAVLLALRAEGRLIPGQYPAVDTLPYPTLSLPKDEPYIDVANALWSLR